MRDRSVTSEAMGEAVPEYEAKRAAPSKETAPIEEWARRKGMFERFLSGPRDAFAIPNPAYQDFAQARANAAWAADTHVTEEDFDAAVSAAKSHSFR